MGQNRVEYPGVGIVIVVINKDNGWDPQKLRVFDTNPLQITMK